MLVDLHNHTPLCHHAKGQMSEYIEMAIKNKTLYFGFSDHAPMDFDPKYRMKFSDMIQYENDVKEMQKKYKDKINILLAYEVDFLPHYMDKRVLNADVDYLIGSVHFLEGWGFDNPEFIGEWKKQNIDEIWQKYFDTIEAMAKTKLFDIVGHLDLIKVFKFMPEGDICAMAKKALLAIKEADMSLELNVAGFRKDIQESYPSPALLLQAYQLNIPITFSSDAHSPEQVALYSQEIIEIAKNAGYTECAYYVKRKRKMLQF